MNSTADDMGYRKLLVVDDNEEFCVAVGDALVATGRYDIRSVDSGESAIQALQEEQFDVVLLDYRLPGISGLGVLRWIGEQKIDTPVILITAVGSDDVAAEAVRLGAYDYVRKEYFEIDHIGLLIEGVYERYRFRQEKERWKVIEKERENSLVAIEMFHGTLASVARIVNTSLSTAARTMREHESRILPYVSERGKQPLAQVFAELNHEYRTISSSVKSVLEVANVLHGNFTDANYARKIHEALDRNLGGNPQAGFTPVGPKDFQR